MSVAPELMAKLVCPVSRTPLRFDETRAALVSDAAGLVYPIRDGVAILLAQAAKPLD